MDCSWSVSAFLSHVKQLPIELREIIRTGSDSQFLSALSEAALNPRYTVEIFVYFEPLFPDLCTRWTPAQRDAAIAAFGRILPMASHLTGLAESLLNDGQGSSDMLNGLFTDNGSTPVASHEFLLSAFRLLVFDNHTFARFIRPASVISFLSHDDMSIRYLAIRILCLYIPASDATMESMISKYLDDNAANGPWEDRIVDYVFLSLWEEKRLKTFFDRLIAERRERDSQKFNAQPSRLLKEASLSLSICNFSETLLIREGDSTDVCSSGKSIVLTESTKTNLKALAEALLQPDPILLIGPVGSGKTFLIRHMAACLNKLSKMVTLHLNEQSDMKMLIGIYTTGPTPGCFQWQPGILTKAVEEGRWLFIEDLDRAPNDVLSAILPLIERRELLIPSRGKKLYAPGSFKIIASMRSDVKSKGLETTARPIMLGIRLWRQIIVKAAAYCELEEIIVSQFPTLGKLVPQIMGVFYHVQTFESSSLKSRSMASRPITLRDLTKWCLRLRDILQNESSHVGAEIVRDATMDNIFLDAVDSFTANLQDGSHREQLISCIATDLHISPQRMAHLLCDRVIPYKIHQQGPNSTLIVGRFQLSQASSMIVNQKREQMAPFATDQHTLRMLEKIAGAVRSHEPVLLVGETGIGKTTLVQHLAEKLGKNLIVVNLSQQSESIDLLGGYKPTNIRNLVVPLKDEFDFLFERNFPHGKNQQFIELLGKSVANAQWKRTVTLWKEALKMIGSRRIPPKTGHPNPTRHTDHQKKRRKVETWLSADDLSRWDSFAASVVNLEKQLSNPQETFTFAFSEGNLVKALRNGDWVLLDEINLATPDTLECLYGLFESDPGSPGSILLPETGSLHRIEAHPGFRFFGAMNPATDIGKKDLPDAIRSRFCEIYVESPDKDVTSLRTIIGSYFGGVSFVKRESNMISLITRLYQEIQQLVKAGNLTDGAGQRPHYSLRTLTRAVAHAARIMRRCSLTRSVYEGFSMCFLTSLDSASECRLRDVIVKLLVSESSAAQAGLLRPLRKPEDERRYVKVVLREERIEHSKRQIQEHRHWLPQGSLALEDPPNYIITPYIRKNLENLIRAVSTEKYPVLIQGPTSAGKTSMVEYLAKRSGNNFVRINNHEHTDLQEYLGTYVSSSEGRLFFQDGVLVQALREGHWVVLDELNLAPSDVLEALNRLLDDNRELLIPETQEVVRPHPNFMLFATQNPAGPYGGRKVLSRAFRNRFLELNFEDIPTEELSIILARRSKIPESWCGLVVEVYKRLSQIRQQDRLFEQHSFATLRDLFRWTLRGDDTLEQLANTGYMLLAEKVRNGRDKRIVKDVIETAMSGKGFKVRIEEYILYSADKCPNIPSPATSQEPEVVWTKAMRRLYVLVASAVQNNEPVLLVGDTGCGKTTVFQILARAMSKTLHIVNAHQNTETGDLIGAQRPLRNKTTIEKALLEDLQSCFASLIVTIDSDLSLEQYLKRYDLLSKEEKNSLHSQTTQRIRENRGRRRALFEWHDGSLVEAMRTGEYYLLDEISLADDSVLERMNSVLDPQRTILLAEKGTTDALVNAKDGFQFLATMNPGGDFGKKELSPALRNRFTEIWVSAMTDSDDLLQITRAKLNSNAVHVAGAIVSFSQWFGQEFSASSTAVSIRDILAWVNFVNSSALDLRTAVVHGAALVFLDTLGANPSALTLSSGVDLNESRSACLVQLSRLLGFNAAEVYFQQVTINYSDSHFHIGPFTLPMSEGALPGSSFNFSAPASTLNALRVARALQLDKPILLEGSPGVGKTSLVSALSRTVGKALVRINLSEQTDLMDLFGSNIPALDANVDAGQFTWRDGPFLAAMKSGDWILLDEMNLASQSVLEGLNACLDHRGEVFIPELDQKFSRHPNFRVFAAQNPHFQGAGRKGLPSSFVNRFTVVYADILQQEDLVLICTQSFPKADKDLIRRMVLFVTDLHHQVMQQHNFGANGAPWEFNLRDLFRWLELTTSQEYLLPGGDATFFMNTLFLHRFRTTVDQSHLQKLFSLYFLPTRINPRHKYVNISATTLQVGLGLFCRAENSARTPNIDFLKVDSRLPLVETLLICLQRSWPVILTGASGAGKSHIIESLASLVGASVDIIAMNADVDATDLVGGYEQYDVSREIQSFLKRLERYVRNVCSLCLNQDAILVFGPVVFNLMKIVRLNIAEPCLTFSTAQICRVLAQVHNGFPSQEGAELLRHCEMFVNASKKTEMGKFEWVDGALVRAIKEGTWIVLDNANLCNSSVLDRLNSVLEPGGTLIINENCAEDGKPRILKPHPNFRIFMLMDPIHGEVSRAMRNRAVEIFFPPVKIQHGVRFHLPFDSSTSQFRHFWHLEAAIRSNNLFEKIVDFDCDNLSHSALNRFKRLCQQATDGLTGEKVSSALTSRLHKHTLVSNWHKDWDKWLWTYYNDVQMSLGIRNGFAVAQPIHLLSNPPLVAYTIACPVKLDPFWLAGIFDLTIELSKMEKALLKAKQSDFPSLSVKGASIIKSPCEAIMIFLCRSHDAMFRWSGLISPRNHRNLSIFHALNWFNGYWWNLFSFTASQALTGSSLQAFKALGIAMLEKLQPHEQLTQDLKAEITNSIEKNFAFDDLSTGLSMERLWHAFRPKTASTLRHLDLLLRLENVSKQFDAVIWSLKAPLEEIDRLRLSISGALRAGYESTTKLEMLAKNFETSLRNLISNAQNRPLATKPYFMTEFEGLCQMSDLHSLFSKPHSNADVEGSRPLISLLAHRSTKSISAPIFSSNAALVTMSISNYAGSGNPNQQAIAIDRTFPLALTQKISKAGNVSIAQLELLQLELVTLGEKVAHDSIVFSTPQDVLLQRFLSKLVSHVLAAHHDLFDPQNARTPEQTQSFWSFEQSISLLPNNHYFGGIARKYLLGQGYLHLQDTEIMDASSRRLADTLLRVSIGCLLLYLPDRLFDPMFRLTTERQLYNGHHDELYLRLDALNQVEELVAGRDTSLRRRLIENDIKALGDPPLVPDVVRPYPSQMKDLHREFLNLLRVIKQLDEQLQSNILPIDSGVLETVAQILLRLSQNYSSYTDLTAPAVGFLSTLRIGLMMRFQLNEETDQNSLIVSTLLERTPYMNDGPKSGMLDASDNLELNIHALRCFAVIRTIESDFSLPDLHIRKLLRILQHIYTQWKADLSSAQRNAAKAASFYHYRGDEDEMDENVEIAKLFPDSDESTASLQSKPSPKDEILQSSVCVIAEIHDQIFGESQSTDANILKLLLQTMGTINNFSDPSTGVLQYNGIWTLFPAILLSVRQSLDEICSNNKKQGRYNLYKDPNIVEVKNLTDFVHRARQRFYTIKEAWPEHATLHNILELCKEILKCKIDDSIMKLLICAEKLHKYIAEWQTVASREFAVTEIYNDLTELLISWRRLELSTWVQLLDQETRYYYQQSKSWWFIAYENIIAVPMGLIDSGAGATDYAEVLVATLDDFLLNSTLGQYCARIRLLKSFQAHLVLITEAESSMQTIQTALGNLVDFRSRYEPLVISEVQKGQEVISKDINEIIKLASWRDTNIEALRQSSKTTRLKLFRQIKRYRKLLGQSVGSILGQKLADPKTSFERPSLSVGWMMITLDAIDALKICQAHPEAWNSRPVRFKNIASTVALMQDKVRLSTLHLDGSEYLHSVFSDIVASIKSLRDDTPSKWTEENKSLLKHLRVGKRKLLSDTMKELRRMGLSPNPSSNTLEAQNSLSKVLSTSSALPPGTPKFLSGGAQAYLYEAFSCMHDIRRSTSDHSDDLKHSEVSRSVGLLESLLVLSLKQQRMVVKSIVRMAALESAIGDMVHLWKPNAYVVTFGVTGQSSIKTLKKTLVWLIAMIDSGIKILNVQAGLGKLDFSTLTEFLLEAAGHLQDLHGKLNELPTLPKGLTSTIQEAVVRDSFTAIKNFRARVAEFIVEFPKAEVTLTHILRWTEVDTHDNERLEKENWVVFDTFALQLFEFLDTILVAIQNFTSIAQTLPSSADDQGWLILEDRTRASAIRALNSCQITKSLRSLLNKLSCLYHQDESILQQALASITSALPIIQEYYSVNMRAVENYAKLYQSVAETLYRLSKAFSYTLTQGFCNPTEKPKESGNVSEKVESGTGLGGGEGAEDISKDIGNDEDLSELAQEPNDSEMTSEKAAEKDAVGVSGELEGDVDIEEEIEGDTDDVSDGDGKAAEDAKEDVDGVGVDSGDADGSDPEDEGFGDVDEQGLSKADEKLWDQAGDHNSKEKEAVEQVGERSKDQVAAGKQQSKEGTKGEDQGGRENGEDDDDDAAEVPMDEENASTAPEQLDVMDPHLKDTEGLDLPEELQLDGDKADKASSVEEDIGEFPDETGSDAEEEAYEGSDGGTSNDKAMEDPSGSGEQMDELHHDQESREDEMGEQDTEKPEASRELNGSEPAQPHGSGTKMEYNAQDQFDESRNTESFTIATDMGQGSEQQPEDQSASMNSAKHQRGNVSQPPDLTQSSQYSTSRESDLTQNESDRETIKQLGDTLQNWHRRQRKIQEMASEGADERQALSDDREMATVEFEHLPAEESQADTQALGTATKDQARALDEGMAMPSEELDSIDPFIQEEPKTEVDEQLNGHDVEMEDAHGTNTGNQELTEARQSQVISGKVEHENFAIPSETDVDGEGHVRFLDDLEDNLSSIRLHTQHPDTRRTLDNSLSIWLNYESRTAPQAQTLTRHLRLILEPTLSTRFRGDFRTGKRLNIKRIIPYIASSYKRDKIWMRRSEPSKHAYQILLAIDNSKSMAENGSRELAFECLAVVAKSLTMLGVGEFGVLGFGETVEVARDLNSIWTSEAGARCVNHFNFQKQRTNVRELVHESIEMLRTARIRSGGSRGVDLWQLELIISDGICENHEVIRRLLVKAQEQRIMIVFIIVDAAKDGQSILDLEKVDFVPESVGEDGAVGEMRLERRKYLETFPFKFFLLVRNVQDLPEVLATALKQWFAEVADR